MLAEELPHLALVLRGAQDGGLGYLAAENLLRSLQFQLYIFYYDYGKWRHILNLLWIIGYFFCKVNST